MNINTFTMHVHLCAFHHTCLHNYKHTHHNISTATDQWNECTFGQIVVFCRSVLNKISEERDDCCFDELLNFLSKKTLKHLLIDDQIDFVVLD